MLQADERHRAVVLVRADRESNIRLLTKHLSTIQWGPFHSIGRPHYNCDAFSLALDVFRRYGEDIDSGAFLIYYSRSTKQIPSRRHPA